MNKLTQLITELKETIFEFIYKLSHFITEGISNNYPNTELLPQFDFITTYTTTTYILEFSALLILFILLDLLLSAIKSSFKKLLSFLWLKLKISSKNEYYIIDWSNASIYQATLPPQDYKFLKAMYKQTPLNIYKKQEIKKLKFTELIYTY